MQMHFSNYFSRSVTSSLDLLVKVLKLYKHKLLLKWSRYGTHTLSMSDLREKHFSMDFIINSERILYFEDSLLNFADMETRKNHINNI